MSTRTSSCLETGGAGPVSQPSWPLARLTRTQHRRVDEAGRGRGRGELAEPDGCARPYTPMERCWEGAARERRRTGKERQHR